MRIAGIQKNSFVDYRGKVAAVIFTCGCNMDCFYCHNRDIICKEGKQCLYSDGEILQLLAQRGKFLDGVVISGGEPTMQPDLEEFIKEVKQLGYPVKLDTNGTSPELVERLIQKQLIDFIAMDIKAPLDKYEEICCANVDMEKIEYSIDLLMEEKVDYEFRTTVVPELLEEDITRIASRISGARLYILQQFRQPSAYRDVIDYRALKAPHSPAFIKEMTVKIGKYVRQYEARGVV